MPCVLPRIAAIRQGDPLNLDTQIGAQVSQAQIKKIENYVKIGLNEDEYSILKSLSHLSLFCP